MTIGLFSVPTPHQARFSWPTFTYPSSSMLIVPLCSPSSTSTSTCAIEESPSSPSPDEPPVPHQSSKQSGCKACGREEIEKGCNGEGRIQGGIATVPGFGWWPIKAYRPCPGLVATGGRYRRQGQSMDEVAFGRGPTPSLSDSNPRDISAKMEDDAETKGRIEETVRMILEESNMDEVTESKIRKLASKQLGLDLSQPNFKSFVKQVVEAFLQEKQQQQQQQEEGSSKDKEYDDDGDLIICKLSERRRVTVQDFRGKTLVSIREYYRKDGKELPSSKGISLTEEQWSALKKNMPAIEKAIKKLESHSM